MCVIAYVERGRAIDHDEFKNCFDYNSDGAGIMYQCPEKGLVHIRKGFMTFEEFWKVASSIPENVERVFHFRIATSGSVSQGITHPFPVCSDYKRMKTLDIYSKKAMVHNGVLTDFAPKEGLKADYSDTMRFNKEIVYPLGNAIFNEVVQNMISDLYGCRYVVMDSDNVAIIGDWVQSKETGILYSNSSYKPYKYTTTKYPSVYGSWDDHYTECYSESYRDDDYSSYFIIYTDGILEEQKEDFEDTVCNELWECGYDPYDYQWTEGCLIVFTNEYKDCVRPMNLGGYYFEWIGADYEYK